MGLKIEWREQVLPNSKTILGITIFPDGKEYGHAVCIDSEMTINDAKILIIKRLEDRLNDFKSNQSR